MKNFLSASLARARRLLEGLGNIVPTVHLLAIKAYRHPNARNEFVHYVLLFSLLAVFCGLLAGGGFRTPLVPQLPSDKSCRPLTPSEQDSASTIALTSEGFGSVPSCYTVQYDLWSEKRFEPFLKAQPGDVEGLEIYPELHVALVQFKFDEDDMHNNPGKVYVADPDKLANLARTAFGAGAASKLKILPAEHHRRFPLALVLFASVLVVATIARITCSVIRHKGTTGNGDGTGAESGSTVKPKRQRVTFEDVAGCEEAIARLQRIIKWQKRPGLYRVLNARPPKGILMVGPPGTGKTWLARALAGELGDVNLIIKSGAEFINKYVGVGAASVRGAFDEGRAATKKNGKITIIFIDEIDALGRKRSGDSESGGSTEGDTTVNQLLTEMDGFSPDENIIVVGATNRPEILDPALKRQGRIDYTISVDRPDREGRLKLLVLYTKNKPLHSDVSLDFLAKVMSGMVGADIKGVCNEAAVLAADRLERDIEERLAGLRATDPTMADTLAKLLVAAKEDVTEELNAEQMRQLDIQITMADFTEAVDILRFGDKLHSKQKNQLHNDQYNTAIHEAGHAGVCHKVCKDPVDKVTRMMRSKSLGMVQVSSEADTYGYTEQWLRGQIMMAFGGCLAQEVILGVRDSGLDSDLAQASKLARYMTGRWGMSKKVGKISLTLNDEGYPACYISEALRAKFDDGWNEIVGELYEQAERVVRGITGEIVHVADVLMEEETMHGDRFRQVFEETAAGASEKSEHLRLYRGAPEPQLSLVFAAENDQATAVAA